MLPVAILAGGLATRLLPVTQKIPKSLVEIAGRPFIFYQLEMLQQQGIDQVVLCLGHLGEQIESVVGDGKAFGLSVKYSYDGPNRLGTGGAIKRALPLLENRFFVLYGDSYLRCSFSQVQKSFEASGAPALMTVLRNNNQWDKSNVLFQNGQIIEYNKQTPRSEMNHIDFGLGILTKDLFAKYSQDQEFDLAEIYQEISLQGQLAGFEVDHRFFEIGSHQGIKEFESFLKTKESTT